MARKPNYSFEKHQRELRKKEKKAAKAEAKRIEAEMRKEESNPDAPPAADSEDQA
ncbi:MAG: hypothetical protein HOH66_03925 [Rhodospirillaceae bacterium]|jgi:hypothetical protein|nr:hypothetical protein [Rhodospirillaceae bacterium]MBT6116991.1 hypothetical protein [Rhodospirillaceae bacterium]